MGPREMRMESGEGFIMRNFIVCTVPNILVLKSGRLRWAGHVARKEEGRSAFKILAGKPTGKRPLGRPRCRMDFKEIRGIGLIQLNVGIIREPFLMRN